MFSEVIRLVGDAAHHGPSLSGEGPFGSVSKEFSVSCRGADGEMVLRRPSTPRTLSGKNRRRFLSAM